MNAELKIPKGYEKIRYGHAADRSTDRWFDRFSMTWKRLLIVVPKVGANETWIRKIKKARPA